MSQTQILPNVSDIEESVLASIIHFPDDAGDVFDALQPSDFYKSLHQAVFSTCLSLRARKQTIDLLTVIESMKKQPHPDGVASAVASIVNAPVSTSLMDHVQIILEKSGLRKMIINANRIIQECYSANGNALQVIDDAQRAILGVEVVGAKNTFSDMWTLSEAAYGRYEKLREGKASGIKTGIAELDQITGGLSGSKLVIIAARPGIGKTALMNSMARHMAERGRRKVGMFSIEMDKEEICDRLVAMGSGINLLKLSTYGPGPDEWPAVQDALSKQSSWPILIDDTGGIQISELKRRVRLMVKAGCEIVFIDQLSKICVPKPMKDFERYTLIVDEIGSLKKELRIPIILLCQINRGSEEQVGRKPSLHHLKSTGRIEEEADIVLLLHRKHTVFDASDPETAMAELMVAKHRGGPCRKIDLYWDGTRTVFYDAAPEGGEI